MTMTISDLNEMTRDDLITINNALVTLARFEHRETGDTRVADRATKALHRIALRYNLTSEDATA